MIYVYSDCDNAVACRDRGVLETYFRNGLAEDMTEAKITELADDATLWGDHPIVGINVWLSDYTGVERVLILVQSLSDLDLLH